MLAPPTRTDTQPRSLSPCGDSYLRTPMCLILCSSREPKQLLRHLTKRSHRCQRVHIVPPLQSANGTIVLRLDQMAPVVAFNKLVVSAPFEIPSSGRPSSSANKVDLPAPLGPTNPIRSPRLTWRDTSSKSARPAKDFESCETVSTAESAQCPLVRCPAQLPSREQTSLYRNEDYV
jgi:hypothetical protein